jgi:hypothetical protein
MNQLTRTEKRGNMTTNQSIENATKNVQSEGRGLCRVLAVGVLLAAAGGAAVIGKDKGKEKEVGDERKAG